jgi:predicted TIM-barrel fold metal-dependent hydrolase
LLPDPEPREQRHLVISTDDHLIEPPDMFKGRFPRQLQHKAPRLVERDGAEVWLIDDLVLPNCGLNAVAGRPSEEWNDEPQRFSEMRRGCYDIDARIHDLDLAGQYATLCFPSRLAGFCGARFSELSDQDLGLACVRAWNDWHHEAWASPYPERVIPLQIPWLADPRIAAEEIERNAQRGFKAVSFPEHPPGLGLPSMHSGRWDPVLRACEATGTVVCLHIASSGSFLFNGRTVPTEQISTLWPAATMYVANEWIWSGTFTRFPELKVATAEGGIGWVPALLDRFDYWDTHAGQAFDDWHDPSRKPAEILQENFYFSIFDDPTALRVRDRIGVDHIMWEVDYPHADGNWPDTQFTLDRVLAGIPEDERSMIAHGNAARLFRHPLPV